MLPFAQTNTLSVEKGSKYKLQSEQMYSLSVVCLCTAVQKKCVHCGSLGNVAFFCVNETKT